VHAALSREIKRTADKSFAQRSTGNSCDEGDDLPILRLSGGHNLTGDSSPFARELFSLIFRIFIVSALDRGGGCDIC
jgi:hypothetical protein